MTTPKRNKMLSVRASDHEIAKVKKLASQLISRHARLKEADVIRELLGIEDTGIVTPEIRKLLLAADLDDVDIDKLRAVTPPPPSPRHRAKTDKPRDPVKPLKTDKPPAPPNDKPEIRSSGTYYAGGEAESDAEWMEEEDLDTLREREEEDARIRFFEEQDRLKEEEERKKAEAEKENGPDGPEQ